MTIRLAVAVAAAAAFVAEPSAAEPQVAFCADGDEACVAVPGDASADDGGLHALQMRGKKVQINRTEHGGPACALLSDPVNQECRTTVDWVANGGGRWDSNAASWFKDMQLVTGVDHKSGSIDDYQRLYFCSPPGGNACGAPPCACSRPPCNKCLGGAHQEMRSGCSGDDALSIRCKAPTGPMEYKGMAWPPLTYHGLQEMHIFAIGDWGGMDGTLNPVEGRPRVVAYSWGAKEGPSVFPRTRWNQQHTEELCDHKQFIQCFQTRGGDCPESCGYVPGVDDQPQQLVASALKERAAKVDPQFLLNVGDNFYWGGIEKTCGTPMNEISFTAHHQFDQIFERVYQGDGLSGKPWLSVLGNHDWGGRVFNNGWDQQIAYTWASDRWVMPAPYYMVQVSYPSQSTTMDVFFLDSNVHDAKEPTEDAEHNLCGSKHNPPGADCSHADGPASVEKCPAFFQELWDEQKEWVRGKLRQSTADWQLVVTHFPCGEDGVGGSFYRELHQQYGLDLLVTGHRHDQELWRPTDGKNNMGGLTCLVTGGGGGITSEATPDPTNTQDWYGEAQYGFYDITVRKTHLTIESINYDGEVLDTYDLTR